MLKKNRSCRNKRAHALEAYRRWRRRSSSFSSESLCGYCLHICVFSTSYNEVAVHTHAYLHVGVRTTLPCHSLSTHPHRMHARAHERASKDAEIALRARCAPSPRGGNCLPVSSNRCSRTHSALTHTRTYTWNIVYSPRRAARVSLVKRERERKTERERARERTDGHPSVCVCSTPCDVNFARPAKRT